MRYQRHEQGKPALHCRAVTVYAKNRGSVMFSVEQWIDIVWNGL